MIYYVTSVTQPWETIVGFAVDAKSNARLMLQPARLCHRAEIEWGDAIIEAHKEAGDLVIAATSELALLRILRRIREGTFAHTDLTVLCIAQLDRLHTLTVDETGEFVDLWPEGFFDGRMGELF